ncbi:putative sulfate exporter family transporter [Kingella potus]|uniref:putative sulfate exporter family transporter n=1 Tax=Kingella potus TaxID=265175 RepID=UPI002467B97C|nr:putative sulfate exporter family transporter [Kingella potus]
MPAFLAAVVLNSLLPLSAPYHQALLRFDTLLLTTAMFALGLTTRWQAVRAAGIKPLLLAGILALWLMTGGGALAYIGYLLFK